MWKKARWLLPHAAILICNMYIVFYAIDRVNTAMNFIDNPLTKGLLLFLCAVGLYDWAQLTRPAKRVAARSAKGAAPAKPAKAAAKPSASRKADAEAMPAAGAATSAETPYVSRKAARLAREQAAAAVETPILSRRAARLAREEAARRKGEAS